MKKQKEMDSFRAYRIDEQDGSVVAEFKQLVLDDLTDGQRRRARQSLDH